MCYEVSHHWKKHNLHFRQFAYPYLAAYREQVAGLPESDLKKAKMKAIRMKALQHYRDVSGIAGIKLRSNEQLVDCSIEEAADCRSMVNLFWYHSGEIEKRKAKARLAAAAAAAEHAKTSEKTVETPRVEATSPTKTVFAEMIAVENDQVPCNDTEQSNDSTQSHHDDTDDINDMVDARVEAPSPTAHVQKAPFSIKRSDDEDAMVDARVEAPSTLACVEALSPLKTVDGPSPTKIITLIF